MHVLVLVTVAHDPQVALQLLVAVQADHVPVAVQQGGAVVVVVGTMHCVDGSGSAGKVGCGPHE